MRSLKILITAPSLAGRSGGVLYVRDLALGLLRQGHSPVVFAPQIGDIGRELRVATVPVVDQLDQIGAAIDVIIGNGHPELVLALLRFPEAAGIHVCHARDHWLTRPPAMARVQRVAAVDVTCRDWLINEHRWPESKVVVIRNAVDLNRFQPREPLPAKPRRALVFSSYLDETNGLGVIREACAQAELPLEIIGQKVGRLHGHPESILREYDLVFAKARCALEALAVGCAVILCGAEGSGPLVTTNNLDFLWPRNFGCRVLWKQPTVADYLEQIRNFDPADAAQVSARVRQEGNLEVFSRQMIALCHEVIAEKQSAPAADSTADLADLTAYLRQITPLLSQYYALLASHFELSLQFNRLQREHEALASSSRSIAPCQEAESAIQSTVTYT